MSKAVGSEPEPPPIGGKGEFIRKHRLTWESNVLRVGTDENCWQYREGRCIDLATLFLTFGKQYTATQLYRYWNTLTDFADKRPHPWASPWVREAAHDRYRKAGCYGHRC